MMTEMTKYKKQSDADDDVSSLGSVRTVEFAGGGKSRGTTRIHCHMGFHYWKKRTCLEKILLFISCFLLLLVSILIWLIHTQKAPLSIVHSGHHHISSVGDLCLNESCVKIAGSILRRMNVSMDPCEDFYEYACGGWIATTVKPEGKPSWGTLSELLYNNEIILKKALESPDEESVSEAERKAKIFYRSCIDANNTMEKLGANPLLKLIKEIGGWSLYGDRGEKFFMNYSLEEDIYKSKAEFASTGLFSWGVAEDDKNSTNFVLKVNQGGLSLPARDYYLEEKDKAVKEAYIKYITKIGVLLGADKNVSNRVANNIVNFETKLANITVPDENKRDDEKNYHNMTLQSLSKLASFMDWTKFVNSAYRGIYNERNLLRDTKIVVYAPDYLSNLWKILNDTLNKGMEGKRTIHDYLIWHIIKSNLGYLSRDFTEAYSILQKAQFGVSSIEEEWRECVGATDAAFGTALGAMFVRRAFSAMGRSLVKKMLYNIRDAFKESLSEISWMDSKTMEAALEKTDSISDMIGHPDFILDPKALDEKFEEIIVHEDTFFENNLNVTKYNIKEDLLRLFKQVNKTKWEMTPPTVNAYYSPTRNNIALPAGILQAPLFDKENPDALNYGAVGVVIGHELSHAFDDQGRKYDKEGNLNDWWKNETANRFKEKGQCMIDQYSEYTLGKEHLKGKLTLGENIADNGGLKAGYRAYQKTKESQSEHAILPGLKLTPNQLFFLAFGQVWCSTMTKEVAHLEILKDAHALPKFRVLGVLSNSKEFSEAYKCPPTSKMFRKDKCIVW